MDYKKLLFNIDIPSGHNPAGGMLLVSEPFLHEEYFNHAVIILADYQKGGTAMGVVLNNESRYSLQELISDVMVETPIPVFSGGPLADDHLFFLHTLGDLIPDTHPVCDGLWIGGDFDAMRRILNDGYPIEEISDSSSDIADGVRTSLMANFATMCGLSPARPIHMPSCVAVEMLSGMKRYAPWVAIIVGGYTIPVTR